MTAESQAATSGAGRLRASRVLLMHDKVLELDTKASSHAAIVSDGLQ